MKQKRLVMNLKKNAKKSGRSKNKKKKIVINGKKGRTTYKKYRNKKT